MRETKNLLSLSLSFLSLFGDEQIYRFQESQDSQRPVIGSEEKKSLLWGTITFRVFQA